MKTEFEEFSVIEDVFLYLISVGSARYEAASSREFVQGLCVFNSTTRKYIIMSYELDVCYFLPVVQKISLMRKIF